MRSTFLTSSSIFLPVLKLSRAKLAASIMLVAKDWNRWEFPFVLTTIVFFLRMAALVSGGAKLKERG